MSLHKPTAQHSDPKPEPTGGDQTLDLAVVMPGAAYTMQHPDLTIQVSQATF